MTPLLRWDFHGTAVSVLGLPVTVFICIILVVPIPVPMRMRGGVVGAACVTAVAMGIGDDTKYFVVTNCVGVGTPPMAVLC